MPIILQCILLVMCIAGASFFAGSETGFVSWNTIKTGHRAAKGDIVARWAQFLLKHKDRVLSAQLIGNNVCIVGASLAFASLIESIDHRIAFDLASLPSPESWLLTPFLALFGEMLPKSLYRLYPFRLTMRSIPVLTGVYFITLPFTWIFTTVTGFLRRNRTLRGESFMTKVREEMVLVAMEGSKSGTIFRSADVLIQNVLEMNEKKVADVAGRLTKESTALMDNCFDEDRRVGEVKTMVTGSAGILVKTAEGSVDGYCTVLDLVSAHDDTPLRTLVKPLPCLEGERTVITVFRNVDERIPFVIIRDRNGSSIIETVHLLQGALQRG